MSKPTHEVIIYQHAIADLEQSYRFIWTNGGEQASLWFERFVEQLKSLDRTPERCPVARESKRVFFGFANCTLVGGRMSSESCSRSMAMPCAFSVLLGRSDAAHPGEVLKNPSFGSEGESRRCSDLS